MPKTNPRRIPRTQADVDKAYSNGIVEGLNRGIDLMLYVLIDKHDAPMDDVQQLAGELNHAAQCVAGRDGVSGKQTKHVDYKGHGTGGVL